MPRRRKTEYSQMQNNLLLSTFVVMMLSEISQTAVNVIDSLITGNFLGQNSLAACGMAVIYFSIIGIASGILAVGVQKKASDYLGKGNKEEADSLFSTGFVLCIGISLLITLIFLIFAVPIGQALGARGDAANLLPETKNYLISLSVGTLPNMTMVLLTPILLLDGKRAAVQISVICISVSDVLLDLAAVYLGAGLFGMGLASSLSAWIGFLILFITFITNKQRSLHIKFHLFHLHYLRDIAGIGWPKAVKRLYNTITPIFLNNLLLVLGASSALAAKSVQSYVMGLTDCVGAGLGSAIFLMVGVYYGEKDLGSIRQSMKSAMLNVLTLQTSLCLLIFIFARPIAMFYVREDPVVLSFAVNAIRFTAINIPLRSIIEVMTNYALAINRTMITNFLNLMSRCVFLILFAYTLSKPFGLNGVWMAFPASSLMLILCLYCYIRFKTQKQSNHFDRLLYLPDDFYIPEENRMRITISNMTEALQVSTSLWDFCTEHAITDKRRYVLSLSAEELVKNILEHGFTLDNKKHHIDVSLTLDMENQITLRVRDDCKLFDPTEMYREMKERADIPGEDAFSHLGIRMISSMAKSIRYLSTFHTNNVIITV